MSNLEAIVLVGGKGTRLRPVVSDRPKPMADVLGKPFLEWMLCYLREQGIQRVILATGYKGDYVRAHFGDGAHLGLKITYSQEDMPLGTGGAVRNALSETRNEKFFVLNGDSFCFFKTKCMLERMSHSVADAVLWGVYCDDASRYGTIVIDDDQRMCAFEEKRNDHQPGFINAGVYLLSRSLVEAMPLSQAISLEREVFPSLISKEFFACLGDGPFIDIGTPDSYQLCGEFLLKYQSHFEYR
jgi:D-glycero-alpha-D-manno-heptose 1-phosphate guanylyltransferase